MIRKIFHITLNQWRQLKKLSESTGLSVAEHVRRAIDMYLEKMGM